MINLYVNLIRSGKWTLERVPIRWRDEVSQRLYN